MPLYSQYHENARQFLMRLTLYAKTTTIQNLHPIHYNIQIQPLVFQRCPNCKKYQQTKKKCNARQLFRLLVPFKHLLLMALKLLQASYPSLSTCTNSTVGIISDIALFYPCMPLTCY